MMAIILAIGLTLGYHADANATEPAGLTTGSSSGTYYAVGKDIASACSSVVPLTVYESAGSVSNVERVLSDKRYQYGIVQQDALAYKALSDQKAKDKIKMIMPLYNDDIHLIATQQSNIRSINDLRGKRVIVGADGSGNWVTSQIIKAKTGIQWTDVEVAPDVGLSQLLLGQADAMFYVIGKPAKLLQQAGSAANGKIRLVPIQHPNLDGFYISSTIPDGIYDWSKTPVRTYSVKNVLVTFDFKSQYQKEIGGLTACIVNHLGDFQATGHSKWREVDPSDYKLVKWPTHPISQRYLDRTVK
jgi:TRAP transporter TAXI family solute receptor